MRGDLEAQPERTPIVRKAVAGLVLAAVAFIAVNFVIHIITTVLLVVVVVVAVAAVLWALNTLL